MANKLLQVAGNSDVFDLYVSFAIRKDADLGAIAGLTEWSEFAMGPGVDVPIDGDFLDGIFVAWRAPHALHLASCIVAKRGDIVDRGLNQYSVFRLATNGKSVSVFCTHREPHPGDGGLVIGS